MLDARNLEVSEGEVVLIAATWANGIRFPFEASFSHYDETLEKAFYVNPKTGRLNRVEREHIYKLPPRP